MTLSPFQAVVRNFEPHSVRVREEYGKVVWGVLGIQLRYRDRDTGFSELGCRFLYVAFTFYAQAEMMESRRVGTVSDVFPRRAKNIAEMAIEILHMPLAVDSEFVLTKAKRRHYDIIEFLGPHQVGNGYVEVIPMISGIVLLSSNAVYGRDYVAHGGHHLTWQEPIHNATLQRQGRPCQGALR